jgi:hypothetical protein
MLRHGLWLLVFQFSLCFAAQPPVLNFSDLTSGPKTGNTDTSLGQTSGTDGVIVTVWGTNLGATQGSSKVFVNGAEARVYSWGNATAPADLYTRHHLQMIAFQVSHLATDGVGTIAVNVNGVASNTLPFTVRAGKIYFVKPTGDDSAGDGSWNKPWKTLGNLNFNGALTHLLPGDTLYVCDGVQQTVEAGDRSVMNLDDREANTGTVAMPKALVGYPGAHTLIGNTAFRSTYSTFISGATNGYGALNWTISKLTMTALNNVADLNPGFRIIGNHVSAPQGSDASGAVEGSGNNLVVLGNEITQVGAFKCTKLYHPIYISGARTSSGPRLPTESNREIAWNYLHDNYANDGINIYSEDSSSAYITNHRVHHNVVVNQTGRGMLIGSLITGENWFYDNVIEKAGLGPVSPEGDEGHFGVQISAGDRNWNTNQPINTNTLIHFCNNTLYGCGWSGSLNGANGALLFAGLDQYTLDFSNNIIQSTGDPYVAGWSDLPASAAFHNVWFGAGAAPAWDTSALSADPKFVNAAGSDFHLLSASPAIDVGLAAVSTFVTVDFDNLPRPQGKGLDLGAFEFDTGYVPPPPPPPPPPPVPTINSGPTAIPNPAHTQQSIAFSVAATDDQPTSLEYAWSFGDGGTGSGATTAHAYAGAGTYTVQVTVTDAAGGSASGTVSVVVSSSSTGGGGGDGDNPSALMVKTVQGSAHFKISGRDTASITGVLPQVPAQFTPTGQAVVLNIDGAIVNFTLDAKGHGSSDQGTFALKLKLKRDPATRQLYFPGGDVPFSARLKNGTWASAWGMNPAVTVASAPIKINASVQIGTLLFAATVDALYTAKASLGGSFKK